MTDDFWLIAGPAAEGTLSTSFAEPVDRPGVQELVAAFRAGGYEPVGNTLHTYAAVQAWAQAVAVAGTTDADAVMEVLRSHDFETVLGTVGFDDRGEVYGYEPFAWYVWRAGKYLLAETPAR